MAEDWEKIARELAEAGRRKVAEDLKALQLLREKRAAEAQKAVTAGR